MSEIMSEIYNILEKQPSLGEGNKIMTGLGMRCLSDGHFCWDDESGDDYENDIQESFFWSYDRQLKEQCLTAHKDFIITSARNNLVIKDIYKKKQKFILQWINCNYIIYDIRKYNNNQSYIVFEFYNKDGEKIAADVNILKTDYTKNILPRLYNYLPKEKFLFALSKTNEYEIYCNIPNINNLSKHEPWLSIGANDFVLKTHLGFFASKDFGLDKKSLEELMMVI